MIKRLKVKNILIVGLFFLALFFASMHFISKVSVDLNPSQEIDGKLAPSNGNEGFFQTNNLAKSVLKFAKDNDGSSSSISADDGGDSGIYAGGTVGLNLWEENACDIPLGNSHKKCDSQAGDIESECNENAGVFLEQCESKYRNDPDALDECWDIYQGFLGKCIEYQCETYLDCMSNNGCYITTCPYGFY
jgi:hypothetical protein